MKACLVSSEILVDECLMRAEVLVWAIERYPMLVTSPLEPREFIRDEEDIFRHDEELAEEVIVERFGIPQGAVEPALMRRLLRERRFGASLYEGAFGEAAKYWMGPPALGSVRARHPASLGSSDLIVVLSPRSRVDTMLSLLWTQWSTRVASVVSVDDVPESKDMSSALLVEGLRRLKLLAEPEHQVELLSTSTLLKERFQHIAL